MDVEVEPTDSATLAFTDMRDKIASLTRAVDSMAGEWKALDIPDYTETLEQMTANVNAVAKGMKALRAAPALELTPETLAAQIAAAGAGARKIEQQELASAAAAFVKLGSQMAGFLASARTENEQNKWVLGFGGLCLVFGLAAATILPDPIYRAMPESWHWPEKRAANMLDRDMWEAGERLQAVADPNRWEVRAAIEVATEDSKKSITGCLKAVSRTRKPIQCSIIFKFSTADSPR
jgi:Family of unknown function (DUF6118)